MKNFDAPYVDNNTYPKRLDDCLESLCQQAGLVLGSKNFPNNSYMIKGNPFTNGETRKTVLSNLVQLTGGFAEVDIEDGKLYVRNLDVGGEPVETIDGNNYDEFKPNNVFGPVNSIRLLMNSSVEGEETIKEADGVTNENRCQITIADNYYLTSAEERETVINGIFNALNGLTYLPVEINYYGYPWLKLGSKIKVKDKNDNEYITYVMEHTLKYNGAYSGKIKATALTKTQVAYKETSSLKQFKRNTELAVDKINGKITEIIEEQSDQSNKLVQIEKDINGVTTKVSSVETQVTNITNTQAQAEGKNIHIDDSAEEPFVDISLHGESTQSGTPTPDNKVDIENIEGNIEFKVEGKNRFDKEASYIFKTNNVDKIVLDTGVRIQSTATYTTNATNFYVVKLGNITDYLGKTIRIKTTALLSSDTLKAMFYLGTCTDDGTSRKSMKTGTLAKGVSGEIFVSTTISSEQGDMYDNLMIALYSTGGTPISSGDYIDYNELIVTADDEDMTYTPYKSQVEIFPLGEEKLMEGSYLADDGIHHRKGQYKFTGNEKYWGFNTYLNTFWIKNSEITNCKIQAHSKLCNYFQYTSKGADIAPVNVLCEGGYSTPMFGFKVSTDVANSLETWKTWLQNHNLIVEYDLAEPEIVPYTEEQQEAWNKIKALMTYKNITNITSDAYAKVIYMRDNGLDVYETKQNAEKNYTETTKKLAEQKITVDGIVSEVSETKSNINTINNNLIELNETVSTTEQRVNEYEIKFEEKTKTINEELKENSETIKSMSYTFNTDELSIAKSDDPVNAKINNSGMRVYSYNELKAIFNDKGTGIQKLIVVGSAQIGNLQIVKATDENGEACTDFHHLVSNIQNLEDLEVG